MKAKVAYRKALIARAKQTGINKKQIKLLLSNIFAGINIAVKLGEMSAEIKIGAISAGDFDYIKSILLSKGYYFIKNNEVLTVYWE